ncbi:hypothetical protein DFP92_101105 [Yoonia sediminilitoris]|uniref:DUF465 domain-containing protein n=2 Tax=Yoonia sediminilitoris TaxID=1286148 RepID=A0A2T6KPP3_9RHOB|nr:hypothetical protein C8N45_101105 [Yoonia sediminilitoris]RCW98689.1 hypothetical protein DFP92_101105 [Yoonia sediminilitoris]
MQATVDLVPFRRPCPRYGACFGLDQEEALGRISIWYYPRDLSSWIELGKPPMNTNAKMEQREVLRVELAVLKREHRDLDEAIEALQDRGSADMLTVKRLKKQKLALKDRIVALEDRITPDIIA